jgi:hypothetical protein
MERTWKPFNPLLGETFEIDLDNGVRFFAEQVPTVSLLTAFNESILPRTATNFVSRTSSLFMPL